MLIGNVGAIISFWRSSICLCWLPFLVEFRLFLASAFRLSCLQSPFVRRALCQTYPYSYPCRHFCPWVSKEIHSATEWSRFFRPHSLIVTKLFIPPKRLTNSAASPTESETTFCVKFRRKNPLSFRDPPSSRKIADQGFLAKNLFYKVFIGFYPLPNMPLKCKLFQARSA